MKGARALNNAKKKIYKLSTRKYTYTHRAAQFLADGNLLFCLKVVWERLDMVLVYMYIADLSLCKHKRGSLKNSCFYIDQQLVYINRPLKKKNRFWWELKQFLNILLKKKQKNWGTFAIFNHKNSSKEGIGSTEHWRKWCQVDNIGAIKYRSKVHYANIFGIINQNHPSKSYSWWIACQLVPDACTHFFS